MQASETQHVHRGMSDPTLDVFFRMAMRVHVGDETVTANTRQDQFALVKLW